MTMRTDISALRQHIAKQERISPHAWPIAPLGLVELDQTLPDRGLPTGALYEIMPDGHADFGAALGVNLAMLARVQHARPGAIVWVQPHRHAHSQGTLYPTALSTFGIDPDGLLHLSVPKSQAMLWALEEALGEKSVAAVVGILPENDRTYDFTASRRLLMRASRHGATAFILASQPAFAMATAADMRWSVASAASLPAPRAGQFLPGMGAPRWQLHLSKSRKGATGRWLVDWNHETLSFRLAAPLADRTPLRQIGHAARQSAAA